MARTSKNLVATVVLAVSAVLFVPAFAQAVEGVSFGRTRYSAYLEPILTHSELLLALFALVVLAAFILDSGE